MASIVDASNLAVRLRPCLAILEHDLGSLCQSKLIRIWLATTAVLTLIVTMGNWVQLADGPLIAVLLFPYLVFPWFFVAIILGVTPVSGARAETLADGILSRPVTRHGYLLATWAARVVTVLGVYLAVIVPAIAVVTLASRPVPQDTVTFYGVVSSLWMVGLVLTFIVSLGFFAGTLLRKPLLAVALLVFVWYPVNLILNAFSLEAFSPISLNRAIPTQLRSALFTKDDGPNAKVGKTEVDAFADLMTSFGKAFSTTGPAMRKDGFFNAGASRDFSLIRVTLGYGLPTLTLLALSVWRFYRRDL